MRIILLAILLLVSPCCFAIDASAAQANPQDFNQLVLTLKQRLQQQGFSKAFLNKAFANVYYIKRTIVKDKHQPEVKLTLPAYLKHMMVPGRIRLGYEYMQKNQAILKRVEQRYHVSGQYVVALLGLESSYGRVTGRYPEISTLVTLIYNGHRAHYFYKELTYALKIVRRGDASLDDLKGSWAGAMGQPQFMPTHYYDYAVDFDGKGKKDIWHNTADVLGSIAYSLHRYGWQYKMPIAIEVRLHRKFSAKNMSLHVQHSVDYWLQHGVNSASKLRPYLGKQASLLMIGGHSFLTFKNFEILHHWNRSALYVMAVVKLAEMVNMSPAQCHSWLEKQLHQ